MTSTSTDGNGPPRICWVKKHDPAGTGLNVLDQVFTDIPFDTVIHDNVGGFRAATPGKVYVPDWASWIKIFAHVTFRPQMTVGAVDGIARIHLWRNDSPTDEDAHYHTVKPYRVGYTPPSANPGLPEMAREFHRADAVDPENFRDRILDRPGMADDGPARDRGSRGRILGALRI